MQLQNFSDDLKIKLINSPLINTDIGLNYFNNNKALYLKILHSFTQRYENLNLQNIEKEELERTLHTIKGLTLTLGMEPISHSIKELEKGINEISLRAFNKLLNETLKLIKYIK